MKPLIIACLLSLTLPLAAQKPSSDGISHIADGLQFVDGKPFIKTAGWWGINHWMTQDPEHGVGKIAYHGRSVPGRAYI